MEMPPVRSKLPSKSHFIDVSRKQPTSLQNNPLKPPNQHLPLNRLPYLLQLQEDQTKWLPREWHLFVARGVEVGEKISSSLLDSVHIAARNKERRRSSNLLQFIPTNLLHLILPHRTYLVEQVKFWECNRNCECIRSDLVHSLLFPSLIP